ncbi:MAG: hypothetical protein ACF8MJ_00205 [Phycisphaerales bacterium JB050]
MPLERIGEAVRAGGGTPRVQPGPGWFDALDTASRVVTRGGIPAQDPGGRQMFGKRRSKDEQDGDRFEDQQSSGGSFGGPFMPQTPPDADVPASRPLYGGGNPDETTTSDDRFASNLQADLAEHPASDAGAEADHAPDESVEVAQEQQAAEPEPASAPVGVETREEPPAPPVAPAPDAAIPPVKGMRGISKDGDQMLGLLSTIESQLGELQRLKADRESLIDDLEQARQELDAQQALLDEREKSVAALEEESRENQRITENMLAEAEKREAELEKARVEVEEHRKRTEELERTLDERSQRLESRDAELRRRVEEIEARERETEQRDHEMREQIAGEFESRLRELGEELEATRNEIEGMRTQLDERNAEIEKIRTEAEERMQQREQELRAEMDSRLEGEKQSVDERVRSLESELDQARAAIEEAGNAANTERSRREELEAKVGELSQQLEDSQHRADEAQRQASAVESEQGSTSEAAAQADARRAELEAELSKTRDQLAEAGRHLSDAQEQARAAGEKVESLSAEVESLKSEVSSRPEASSGGIDPTEITKRDRAIELLKGKLDQAMTRVRQLEERASSPSAGGSDGSSPQKGELDAMHQKLLAKQQELDVLAHKLAAREKALEQKGTAAKPMSPMSSTGSEQEREAIRKESEQLFAQREQLAEAKAALDRKAKKVAASASKRKAANIMLASVVTMAILAMLSWYAAGQIAKPIHVASVELGIDPQETDLSPRQKESWQEYHEALLDDPQFHELAARRLKQRGYANFGTPSDVRAMVTDGLVTWESSADGELTLLYTAAGRERTERVLDTFSGALSSFANETRDHRLDGVATAVIEPVSTDPTPVEDPRLNFFAMMFGGACGVALFGSMVMWRRMSRDLTQFEDRLTDSADYTALEIGPTEGAASTEGRRLMF